MHIAYQNVLAILKADESKARKMLGISYSRAMTREEYERELEIQISDGSCSDGESCSLPEFLQRTRSWSLDARILGPFLNYQTSKELTEIQEIEIYMAYLTLLYGFDPKDLF